MSEDYGNQREYMNWVKEDAECRKEKIEKSIKQAFSNFITKREVDVILFSDMQPQDLAGGILEYPEILKALLSICNVAARAIEKDLNMKSLNTYDPKISKEKALILATYLKPFLPPYLELNALSSIDRIYFIDKEIRKLKGRWEQDIIKAFNKISKSDFKKRKFFSAGESFEIDAANPVDGDIKIGIDIKRIEARRDIHKRCDEIVNKAGKLKSEYPDAKFGVIMFYPFIEEHTNIQSRLKSANIDFLAFASESKDSINTSIQLLLASLTEKEND